MSKISVLFTLLFTRLAFLDFHVWTSHVRLTLSSPNACLTIARVIVALLPRHSLFLCQMLCEIASGRYTTQIKGRKNQHITQLRNILCIDSQDMLVLSPVASFDYNCCCTDGST
jgi:hypothetical protein